MRIVALSARWDVIAVPSESSAVRSASRSRVPVSGVVPHVGRDGPVGDADRHLCSMFRSRSITLDQSFYLMAAQRPLNTNSHIRPVRLRTAPAYMRFSEWGVADMQRTAPCCSPFWERCRNCCLCARRRSDWRSRLARRPLSFLSVSRFATICCSADAQLQLVCARADWFF